MPGSRSSKHGASCAVSDIRYLVLKFGQDLGGMFAECGNASDAWSCVGEVVRRDERRDLSALGVGDGPAPASGKLRVIGHVRNVVHRCGSDIRALQRGVELGT